MKLTRLLTLLVLIVSIAGAAAPAAAQANNSTPANASTATSSTATPPPTNATTEVVIGPLARVTSWSYADGTFRLTIEAKAPTLLTISESPETQSSGSGTISFTRHRLSRGTNELTVPVSNPGSDATLILSTPGSVNRGEAAFIRHSSGSALVSGPFDGADVRNSALGAALAVALGALYQVVKNRYAVHDGMERVA